MDEIRNQTLATDWTAQLVEGASIANLDPAALKAVREIFATKNANRISAEEIESWSDEILLSRARLTINGSITRATLLLLGNSASVALLSPNPAEITWHLTGEERAYEHFSPPFLLTTTMLFGKIRNIQIRVLPDNELLVREVSKYDQKVVLEALHNCIVHQDYTQNARVTITEQSDCLILQNLGGFFEGEPADYVSGEKRPPRYRNSFLAQAMTELNMIDRMGYGIHDIYKRQRQRFFPLPDYDLSQQDRVNLTIHGRIVDPAYSQLLMQNTALALVDVLNLDRVQKKLPITDEAIKYLRRKKLIEGRKPNFYVSARVAAATQSKAEYIRIRAQNDDHYQKLLIDYLEKFGSASRQEINNLLLDKVSEALSEEQKLKKVGNLLTKLRRNRLIVNTGSKTLPKWKIAERNIRSKL